MSDFLIRFRLTDGSIVSFSAPWVEVDRWAEEGLPAPQTAVEKRVLDWLRFGYRVQPTHEGSGALRSYVNTVVVFKVRTTPPPTIDVETVPTSSSPRAAERKRQRLLRAVERLLHGDRPCVVACDSVSAAAEGIATLCAERSWPAVVWNTARGYVPEPVEYFPNWQSPDTFREGTGGVIYPHATPFFERALWCLLAENISKQAMFLICDPPFDRLPDSGIGPLMVEVAAAHRRDGQFRTAVLQSHDRVPPEMGGDWDLVRLNVQSATPILDRYGTNLCEEARAGRINRAYGVDAMIHRMVTVLNALPGVPSAPVLVGAAGTGKTAIVYEMAVRLSQSPVDPNVASLAGKQIVSLNTARIQEAADRMGGLPSVVNALATELADADDIILFIDEVHQLAVSDRAGLPIGEVLKEALGRGLPLIGATTSDEWSAYIEKDRALQRRFEPIYLREVTTEEMIRQMREVWVPMVLAEKGIDVSDDVLRLVAQLADRYMGNVNRPSRGIYLLDRASTIARLTGAGRRHLEERDLYAALSDRLGRGVSPNDQIRTLEELQETLRRNLVGQDEAIERILEVADFYFAGSARRTSPIVILAVGGPGTGKSKAGELLHKVLFPGPSPVSFDMTEYREPHSIATMFGSPPGYVGHGAGSLLARRIKEANGLAVVRLDEWDKGHPEVRGSLLGIFENGTFQPRDNSLPASFLQAIFWITSNAVMEPDDLKADDIRLNQAVEQALTKAFIASGLPESISSVRPFLSRVHMVVPFVELSLDSLREITRQRLGELNEAPDMSGISFEVMPEAMDSLARRAYESKQGARDIQHQVTSLGSMLRGCWRKLRAAGTKLVVRWDAASETWSIHEP